MNNIIYRRTKSRKSSHQPNRSESGYVILSTAVSSPKKKSDKVPELPLISGF